jgi:hypothetical protein
MQRSAMEEIIKRLELEAQRLSQRQLITMQRQQQILEQQGKMATSQGQPQGQQQSAHMWQQHQLQQRQLQQQYLQQQQQQQQQQHQPVRSNPTSTEQHLQQPQRPKQEQPEATFQYHRQTEMVDLRTNSPPQAASVRASAALFRPTAAASRPSDASLRPWVANQMTDGSWAVPSMGIYAQAIDNPPLHTLYNSTLYSSPYTSTTQQFTPQPRSRSHSSDPANTQPIPHASPSKSKSHQLSALATSSPRVESPQNRYNPTDFNERQEQARLEEQRLREAAHHAEREYIIASDPHMNYRNYLESLRYFPVPRGERPNPYLSGLIANQILPADPNSDRAIAIRFAKKHWDKYWEMRDIELVLEWAKTAQNRDSEPEGDDA